MARTYLTFVELRASSTCSAPNARMGRYSAAKLIERHIRKGNLMVWREMTFS